MRSANISISPEPRRGATTANAAPARCSSMDGASFSCPTLAVMKDGAEITTIEGLATNGELHPLQKAFISHDGFQCGYCTPGQICSAVGLIAEGHAKTADEIRELMSGNVCRCGCYPNIVAAIEEVMQGAPARSRP